MFTGIIESVGKVVSMETEGTNIHFEIESNISNKLKIDQSVSHNGVCLTVIMAKAKRHKVTVVEETLKKSNLGNLKPGEWINLERCLLVNGRFDGHIVQGHVDQIAKCNKITNQDGSWQFDFTYDNSYGNLTVEKGSICINGVSLTCFNSQTDSFSVALIPNTFENTNLKYLKEGNNINLEFDIIGKYVKRLLSEVKV